MFYEWIYPLHAHAGLSFLNVFRYITFRAAYAAITALLISWFFGPHADPLACEGEARPEDPQGGPAVAPGQGGHADDGRIADARGDRRAVAAVGQFPLAADVAGVAHHGVARRAGLPRRLAARREGRPERAARAVQADWPVRARHARRVRTPRVAGAGPVADGDARAIPQVSVLGLRPAVRTVRDPRDHRIVERGQPHRRPRWPRGGARRHRRGRVRRHVPT